MSGTDLPPSGTWLEAMGLVVDEAGGDRMVAHIDLGAAHRTPWGVVHGGVYATIVESVGSIGASMGWPGAASSPSGCTTAPTSSDR